MSDKVLDIYSQAAQTSDVFAEMNGRYAIQKNDERKIFLDCIRKLNLQPEDRLLEIGCGVGSLLIPLSFYADQVVGIDNEASLEILKQRVNCENITLIAGGFPQVQPEGQFNKILVYGVILYLKSKDELFNFLETALHHMSEDGSMLLGDITTTGKKDRFANSHQGMEFSKDWRKKMKKAPASQIVRTTEKFLEFDDDLVMEILLWFRKKGYHSYLLEQSPELPFGHTREDILIFGPEADRRHIKPF